MMMMVGKFPLGVCDEQAVLMPKGAKVLSVAAQMGRPCLWALMDFHEPKKEPRRILMRGTGQPADGVENAKFLGTVLLDGGQLVLHLFEKGGAA